MPGFILHLTAAKLLLDKLETPIDQNAFYIGNLLPDTVTDKTQSHFRSPLRRTKRIEYPELEPFYNKYQDLLHDSSVLGYFYHLYIDRTFFMEYLPKVVTFLDKDGAESDEISLVTHAYLKRTDKQIPVQEFLSDSYYYGDFTKMNTYLLNRYQLPMKLDTNVANPGIEEVEYSDVAKALTQLQGYLGVPESAVQELRVFDVEELCDFLNEATENFLRQYMGKDTNREP